MAPGEQGPGHRTAVVLAAAGAPWESAALAALERSRETVVLKRCVDLADLLATVETGRVRVVVVDAELGGLDAATVHALSVRRVGVAAVGADPRAVERVRALGVGTVVDPEAAPDWVSVVRDVVDSSSADPYDAPVGGDLDDRVPFVAEAADHPVVAVWSPPGAPGRTTLAVALAAYVARSRPCVLLDADPAGGAIGQHLAVLDDVSGLLACARMVNQGQLDDARFAGALRRVELRSRASLEVLTGLPRPDRWNEVRAGVLDEVLDRARRRGAVVVDAGAHLGADPEARGRSREQLTRDVVEAADVDLVVATPDAVGLARLSRTLVAHAEHAGAGTLHVAVNRMRPGVGWGEAEVRGMVEGFVGPVPLTFLPDDQNGVDRALTEGRAVTELGEGPLAAAVGALARDLGLVDGAGHPRAGGGRHRPPRRRRVRS